MVNICDGMEVWVVPGDNAKEFPTAHSHIVARSLVGIPAHHRTRIAGLR